MPTKNGQCDRNCLDKSYSYIWQNLNHDSLKKSRKMFIIIVKITSVLHLVLSLIPVNPSSPSKLKPFGTISSAEDMNFCALTCSGSKIFAQPIVRQSILLHLSFGIQEIPNYGQQWISFSESVKLDMRNTVTDTLNTIVIENNDLEIDESVKTKVIVEQKIKLTNYGKGIWSNRHHSCSHVYHFGSLLLRFVIMTHIF